MLSLTILFLSLIITVNTLLWRTYRRGLLREIRELNQRLEARNADVYRAYDYSTELHNRCKRLRWVNAQYKKALLDSSLSNTEAGPMVEIYPVNHLHNGITWLIESYLN